MKKINNIEFESLLLNEEFIRLINEKFGESNHVIADLCLKNADKAESILLVTQLVQLYHADQLDFDDAEITRMWQNIIRISETRKPQRIFRFYRVWSIAASFALLLSLVFYLYIYSSNHSIRKYAAEKVVVSDDARIIISDGSEYRLKSNDSHIRYDADGKEIVIEWNNDQTEKVSNQPKEAKAVFNQIVVPFGRRHSITLSDGTVVQLNSGSKLVFPAKFAGAHREVFLKGEGYFEVSKDASKPFIVNTDFINVKVLGTHFNISAYENEKSAVAVLVEGSVEVYKDKFLNNNHSKIVPGQACFFTGNDSELHIQDVNVNEYISWKDGYYLLSDQPFGNIIKKIEKYYNKSVSMGDNELANRIISGKLVLAAQLEGTMDFLAKATKCRYALKEDGTYIFAKDINSSY